MNKGKGLNSCDSTITATAYLSYEKMNTSLFVSIHCRMSNKLLFHSSVHQKSRRRTCARACTLVSLMADK